MGVDILRVYHWAGSTLWKVKDWANFHGLLKINFFYKQVLTLKKNAQDYYYQVLIFTKSSVYARVDQAFCES